MRNSRQKAVLYLMATAIIAMACFIIFNTSTPIVAQNTTPTILTRSINIDTPGYYYFKPSRVSQDATTAAITLTASRGDVPEYKAGLQVVFTTKVANANNGNITLQIDSLDAERLLTRHGQEFNILELDAGVIMTATYDGTDFISDYTAARTLKGRLIASVDIDAGDYALFQYIEGWTVETGVTEVGTADLPATQRFLGNPVDRTDALLTFPATRFKDSQLGWYFEILNGTTVVNSFFKTFGEIASFSSLKSTDVTGVAIYQNDHTSGSISGVTQDSIGFSMSGQLNQLTTIPAGYSIKMYLSEN